MMGLGLPPIDEAPAAYLEGRALQDGWSVGARITKDPSSSGGHFSVCYIARHTDGRTAFMKALNFCNTADGSRPFVDRLRDFTTAYVFERDLLGECCAKKMTRIVRLIGHGEVNVPESSPLIRDVPYLLFEMADGDINAFQVASEGLDCAWYFQVLKQSLEGIGQLHAARVAHQDLRPSNVLTQDNGTVMKLGDLGRADKQGVDTWWSDLDTPGAIVYAPPEQQYGYYSKTWEERRAADLYLAGSLGTQLFLGHCMSALVQDSLPSECRPLQWEGSNAELMPHLLAAHAEVISVLETEVGRRARQAETARRYAVAISQMTHPDPSLRGHPRDRAAATSSYATRRYVSLMDLLARRVRTQMLGAATSA